MNSRPASSASTLIAAISSHSQGQRSGARLMVRPPSQFALNTPSLNRFGPNNGLLPREASIRNGLQRTTKVSQPQVSTTPDHHTSGTRNGEAVLAGLGEP